MDYIAVIIFFIAVFVFTYGVLYSLNYGKIMVKNRIARVKNLKNLFPYQDIPDDQLFTGKLFKEFYTTLCKFLLKITPSYKLIVLNKKLEKAGLLKYSSAQKWLYNKSMIMLISFISSCLLTYIISGNIIKALSISFIIILFINVYIRFYIAKKIDKRKRNILKDLPYTLDLITVSVEAGASFDGAMGRVITNIKGDICDEFAKCLKEIKMGIQRKLALKNMSERCGVKELTTFVNSLIQADELGVSLGRVLRIEAANLREHRKQKAREKAMKAPVKMLFPLIFFIFPSIFIIILGPALIKIVNVFK